MLSMKDLTDSVKHKIPFPSFYKREFPEKYRSNGNSHAPFREDKKPSFQLNNTFGYDHTTGESWDVYSIRQKTHGLDFESAKQSLIEDYGINEPVSSKGKKEPKDHEASSGKMWNPWQHGKIVATYDYFDEGGQLLYQNLRFVPKNPADFPLIKKGFRPHRPDPDNLGGWIKNLKDTPHVPFGLSELLASPPTETVYDCEGEKDALAMRELGFVAVSSGSSTSGPDMLEKHNGKRFFEGRDVVIVQDNDDVGRKAAKIKARILQDVAKSVKLLEFPDDDVNDAYDFIAKYDGDARKRIMSLTDMAPQYAASTKRANEKVKAKEETEKSKSARTKKPKGLTKFQKLDLCLEILGWKLFFDQVKEPWAAVKINGHVENVRVSSRTFKRLLQKEFKLQFDDGVGAEVIDQVIGAALGEIEQTEEPRPLYYRSTWNETGDKILIDSGRADWAVYEIDAEGWRITHPESNPFKRERAFAAYQCEPDTPRANWKNLFEFLPIRDGDSQGLVKLWLLLALFPNTPRPGLVINGPEGSGKTTIAKKIRRIIAPMTSEKPNRLWNQEENLLVALSGEFISIFDNCSVMTKDSSDLLCQSIDGGRFKKRARYSDADIHEIEIQCTWIITGISNPAKMSDFLSRVFIIETEIIEERDKLTDSNVDRLSEKYRAGFQALIFDGMSEALRNIESVKPEKLHRLAKANLYTLAMTETLGLTVEQIHDLWSKNKKQQETEVQHNNFMVELLEQFVADEKYWEGSASKLIDALYVKFNIEEKPWKKSFPSDPGAMGRRVRELIGLMNSKGIKIITKKKSTHNLIIMFVKGQGGRFESNQAQTGSQTEAYLKSKQSSLLDNGGNGGKVEDIKCIRMETFRVNSLNSLDNGGMEEDGSKKHTLCPVEMPCNDGCEHYQGDCFCLKLGDQINPERCGEFDMTADLC